MRVTLPSNARPISRASSSAKNPLAQYQQIRSDFLNSNHALIFGGNRNTLLNKYIYLHSVGMKKIFKFGLAPFRKFNIKGKIKGHVLYVWGGTAKRKSGKNEAFFFGKLNLITNYFEHKGLLLNNIEEYMVAFTSDRIVSKDY